MSEKMIQTKLYSEYLKKQRYTLSKHMRKLEKQSDLSYSFAFIRSSVFSSMLEGSSIDLNNYLFNKENQYIDSNMQQIDDLVKAYKFAKNHVLNLKNVLKAHEILSSNFNMSNDYKGKLRTKDVYIKTWYGKTVYEGCPSDQVEKELENLFLEIDSLRNKKVSINKAFYYAAYIHLLFVNIHPFADGNGRLSRLLEKWVLVSLLKNDDCWKIPSEINYWIKREEYHLNLNQLGKKYNELDYENSLPFLLMLPTSFGISKKFVK